MVTHDLTSAFKVADHMILLLGGEVVLEGPPDLFREPEDSEVRRFMEGRASDEDLRAIRPQVPLTEVNT